MGTPPLIDIGEAVQALKDGHHVTRLGWNGHKLPPTDISGLITPRMWLVLQRPDAHSKMTLPYVYMRTVQADLVPWLCSQTDLLAEDWFVLPAAEERAP